jgi:hypothetical protein
MSFESALRTHLLAAAAIAAALEDQAANETRYYPMVRPQDQKNLAAIVYQLIAGTPETNLEGGSSGLERKRCQLTIFGADYDAAKALAELVKARLSVASDDGEIKPAVLQLEQDDYDWTTKEAFVLLDYSIHYTPANPAY